MCVLQIRFDMFNARSKKTVKIESRHVLHSFSCGKMTVGIGINSKIYLHVFKLNILIFKKHLTDKN